VALPSFDDDSRRTENSATGPANFRRPGFLFFEVTDFSYQVNGIAMEFLAPNTTTEVKTMKRALILLAVGAATAAQAQTLSSFHLANFDGLTITESNPLKFSVSMAPGTTTLIGGNKYTVKDIFGVYRIATKGGFTSAASKSAPWSWKWDGLSGPQQVAGWENNSKSNSLSAGETFNFEFDKLTSTAGTETTYGFHVRINETFNGSNTFYAYNKSFAPVPEPTSMAILGIGGLAFLRRRFKK
jgi:hypothetical protein